MQAPIVANSFILNLTRNTQKNTVDLDVTKEKSSCYEVPRSNAASSRKHTGMRLNEGKDQGAKRRTRKTRVNGDGNLSISGRQTDLDQNRTLDSDVKVLHNSRRHSVMD